MGQAESPKAGNHSHARMADAPAPSAAPATALPAAVPGSALPDLEGTLKKLGKVTLIGNPWKVRQFKQLREKLFYYKAGSKNPKVRLVLVMRCAASADTWG